MPGRVSFEPMGPADIDWAWDVYRATTQEHIVQVVDWTEQEQYAERLKGLCGGAFEAVVDDLGERVGLVEVTEDGTDLTIRHLELLPVVQGRGLGSAVIRAVADRAEVQGKALALRVLHVNPRARALYERLGFVVVRERSNSTEMRLVPGEGVHLRNGGN